MSEQPPEAFLRAAEQRASKAFDLLHHEVQRWIWKQGWDELRDIQERAIPLLLQGDQDIIIAATTAGGKTEAAFLPIVSRLVERDQTARGFKAIYVSPLRALINDQFGRLEALCSDLEIPVFKWHGDVSQSQKLRARQKPDGILLITPESLEAILVRRGVGEALGLFQAVDWIVVDELHAYLDSPRGKQLQSLLHRIEVLAKRRMQRVGLSATLADKRVAAEFLRPREGDKAQILESIDGNRSLLLQVRGYIEPAQADKTLGQAGEDPENAQLVGAEEQIASDLFKALHGTRNLVFANSRKSVELYTVELSDLCDASGLPTEFLAHHGNLSREYREEAERRMKNGDLPATIVCTSTLELGIDIGNIDSVAQIGCAHTVSGLRQRLGRSGRRAGQSAKLRQYIAATELSQKTHPLDELRPGLIQAIAMINLLGAKWNEPVDTQKLHLSTLLHQILALIAQYGGITAEQGYRLLVESGVFTVDVELYKQLLRRMGEAEVGLLIRHPDGTLLPGPMGERIIQAHDFFAVFKTPTEYRVIAGAKTLGSLPVDNPLAYVAGTLMIFGGRRWVVVELSVADKAIMVSSASGGKPPKFWGDHSGLADGIVQAMRAVYLHTDIPPYLDAKAIQLLQEARSAFHRFELAHAAILEHGSDLIIFPWIGSKSQLALTLALNAAGIKAGMAGIAIDCAGLRLADLASILKMLASEPPPDPIKLAKGGDLDIDKFDDFLSDDMKRRNYARAVLDARSIPAICAELTRATPMLDA
jgi:ATP-dependent Lhr-like helicase